MAAQIDVQWLVDLHDEHGATLHRLCVMLGAENQSGHIVRTALLTLARLGNRIVDPLERLEFLEEHVVHQARANRTGEALDLPVVEEPRQKEIINALTRLPVKLGEIIVVSHYLATFGPDLAGIMRMTVRSSNQRLEDALEALRATVGDPTPNSQPGVIESLSQEITAALRSSARQVTPPGTETLRDELESGRVVVGTRVPWYVSVPILSLCLLLGFTLGSRAGASGPTPSPEESPVSQPTATASRSLPARVRSVPVYYVGREDGMLYREYRDLASTGDITRAALEATLAVAPRDPDLHSLWSGGRVLGTELTGDGLVINLSADAYESITSEEEARTAVLQMVYTATELIGDPDLVVTFQSNSQGTPEAFRAFDGGISRDGLDPMPEMWITAPLNNERVAAGQLLVVGTIKPGQPAPLVQVREDSGTWFHGAAAQVATAANAEGWLVWTQTLTLEPGTYVIAAGPDTAEAAETSGDDWGVETKTIIVE